MTAIERPSYEQALRKMPKCLVGGFDPRDKTTVEGIWWYVRIILDIYEEGDESDIKTAAQAKAVNRYLLWLCGTDSPDEL